MTKTLLNWRDEPLGKSRTQSMCLDIKPSRSGMRTTARNLTDRTSSSTCGTPRKDTQGRFTIPP